MLDGIIGRNREIGVVRDFLDDARGGPGALLLEGDAGIGKTALWTRAIGEARRRSFHVLAAAPAESEAALSYAALWDLLEPLADDVLDCLPAVQRAALDAALLRSGEHGTSPDQRTVAVAVLSVLRSLAVSAPVLVALDDMQWLDQSSARALTFSARRLGSAPVSFLCSLTSSADGDERPQLVSTLPQDRVVLVEIGPLDEQALGDVVRTHVGTNLGRSDVVTLHRACQGNPLYGVEIARELKRRGTLLRPEEPLPVPASISKVLRERLDQLPLSARDVLLLASTASRPTTTLMSLVLGRNARAGLDAAEAAGMVKLDGERVRFTHPLLGSTAYLQAEAKRRQRLHLRLASVLSDPEERARHLAMARPAPDPEVAVALDAAAEAAVGRGAPHTAAQLLEEAARFTPPGQEDEARRRDTAAAEHHIAAGELDRAEAILETWLARTPSGTARASVSTLLARVALQRDSFPGAAALLEAALPEAEPDPRLHASAELLLGFVLAQIGDLRSSSAHASSALRQAERLGDQVLVAQSLAGSNVVNLVLGLPVSLDQVRRAVALEQSLGRPLFISPTFMAAFVDMWTGRLEEARSGFAACYRLVAERGDESAIPLVAGLWGGAVQAECWAGDLDRAEAYARGALASAMHVGGDVAQGLALSAKSWVHAYRGEPEATRKASEESSVLLQRAGVSALCLWPLGTLGFLELSRGDPASAHDALAPIAELVPNVGVGEPATTPFLHDAVEALVGIGEVTRAEGLTEWLQNCCAQRDHPWAGVMAARCHGLVLAAKGELDGAVAALDDAAARQKALPMPVEKARTLLVKGLIHRRRKEKRVAKEVLEESLRTFEHVGATLWAERARAELGRVGVRPPAPLDLTATEERVAELAAAGRTTKEIASQLFMSPKTVESVIGRVYTKLGVRSRAELATVRAGSSHA